MLGACATGGPSACGASPASSRALCAAACLGAELAADPALRDLAPGCDTDATTAGAAGALSALQAAPTGSGLLGVRLLNAVAQDDVGMVHFGASFLVAERADGACLVDRVHDWEAHPSSVETGLTVRWEAGASGPRLWLESERIIREPLDESESADGVSDVRSQACVRLRYALDGGRLTRVERQLDPGPCARH